MFDFLNLLDGFYWKYIGWILVLLVGTYLTIFSKFFQLKQILSIKQNLKSILRDSQKGEVGINPFKIFFSSIGGMVGLGNITGISVAMMAGGPGSLFWTMIAAFLGSLLKYSEIYVGVKYRIKNSEQSFDGGPMYYLQKAFKTKTLSYVFCVLMCLYGVEIYQFNVLVDAAQKFYNVPKVFAIFFMLSFVIYTVVGGVKRIANIASVIMPFFMIFYIVSSLYIIFKNYLHIPSFLYLVFSSAFSGSAAVGGFVGSSFILCCYLGISKAIYSGDICVGYDSIIQSESKIIDPKQQGVLAIYGLLTDNFICILTNIVVGITGGWFRLNHLSETEIIPTIFKEYFGNISTVLISILFFIAGITTINSYLIAGTKAAKFISPTIGKKIYISYAFVSFIFFSCFFHGNTLTNTLVFMSLLSGFLVLINITAIFKLRKEIKF